MRIKSFSIRIEEDLLTKLHDMAKFYQRSMNNQIVVLIRKSIQTYEAKYGKIESNNNEEKTKQ